MDKRTFLKTCSALMAGGILSPLASCRPEEAALPPRTNWAGNLTYSTDRLHLPQTVAEAQELVRNTPRLRPLGSRHCFNAIADSTEAQISLEHLNQVVHLDEASNRVTVGARYALRRPCPLPPGTRLCFAQSGFPAAYFCCRRLCYGYSRFGRGERESGHGGCRDYVHRCERRSGPPSPREEDGERFAGAVVGLGGLGVVTEVTLDIQPAFDMIQHVYLDLPVASLDDHFDEIMSSGYSVSLFTDWQTDAVNQVWIKRVAGDDAFEADPTFFGANLATRNVHPILELSAVNCTEQMGAPGPWYERLPHFRMDFTPSSGKELQSEYFVPREHARDVARLFQGIGGPVCFAPDDLGGAHHRPGRFVDEYVLRPAQRRFSLHLGAGLGCAPAAASRYRRGA